MDPKESAYAYSKDFISFLKSPLTKEIEFEIRIKAQPSLINEYENLLKEKNIVYRKTPLVIFPPPLTIVADKSTFVDCMTVLLSWYARNKGKNIIVSIMDGAGNITDINSERDIEKFITMHQKM